MCTHTHTHTLLINTVQFRAASACPSCLACLPVFHSEQGGAPYQSINNNKLISLYFYRGHWCDCIMHTNTHIYTNMYTHTYSTTILPHMQTHIHTHTIRTAHVSLFFSFCWSYLFRCKSLLSSSSSSLLQSAPSGSALLSFRPAPLLVAILGGIMLGSV